nr:MAG TPA: hypothetical protein [Caudoviricetes sp.]
MARKPIRKRQQPTEFKCRDCQHSYGWCSKAIDGHLILCRCKYDKKSEYGKWCKFLSDNSCDNFLKRNTPDNGNAE